MEETLKFTEEDRNKPFFKGLTPYNILDMVRLAIPYWDWDKYDKGLITLSIMKREPNPYGRGGEFVLVTLPLPNKDYTDYLYGFEIKIWDDGLFCYENGNGCAIDYQNPLKIYEMILKHFKND